MKFLLIALVACFFGLATVCSTASAGGHGGILPPVKITEKGSSSQAKK